MNPRDLLDALSRSSRMPVVARVRHVQGRGRDEVVGRWLYLGTYASRPAAMKAIETYMRAHEGQAMHVSIVESHHPEYRAALASARGSRRMRRAPPAPQQ